MIFSTNSMIGLEMDSREIRAVELKGSQKKAVVSACGRISLPEGVVREGRVVDKRLLSVHLEKLINENGFKGRKVVLGVNNQDVIVRFASFPKVPEDKIKNMIKFQAQDYIPVPMEELELDYIVLGDKKTAEGPFVNVILVGARKKMLNDFIEALTAARLDICEIDSTMLALGRAALLHSGDGTFVLAGFNNDIGNIMIFKDGLLNIARSISITQMPAWISSRQTGMYSPEQDMKVIADILLGEVRSSVSYYKMQNHENINQLFVLGHGSLQKQVATRLSETAGLSAQIPEPYTELPKKVRMKQFSASEYTAGLSLAMRGLKK